MKTFELNPVDGRKYFYGKARVEQDGNISYLYSYSTIVAYYNHETNKMIVKGYYSATTARHINSFLSYYGFNTYSKKELESYNNVSV